MPSTAKRSGNPAKRAAVAPGPTKPDTKPVYGKKVWGNTAAEEWTTDLEVPSGEICKVRRPGVEGLMQAGVLHDIDSLTGLVNSKHLNRVSGQPEIDVESLLKDQTNMENLLHVCNRVVCYVVVEPEVRMAPNDPTSRESGEHVYTDQIDIEDKMFILNFAVGGSNDVARFRRESEMATRGMGDEQRVSDATS